MTLAELDVLIASIAAGDKTISRDGSTLTSHDLGDLIKYREALAAEEAGTTGNQNFGMRFTQLVPPGAG